MVSYKICRTLIKRKQWRSSLLLINRSTDLPIYSANFWNSVLVSSSVRGLIVLRCGEFSVDDDFHTNMYHYHGRGVWLFGKMQMQIDGGGGPPTDRDRDKISSPTSA